MKIKSMSRMTRRLERLNNLWDIVYNMKHNKKSFKTYLALKIKYVTDRSDVRLIDVVLMNEIMGVENDV